ncbi:MAG: hypothetical protein ACE37K_12560 [Planctomycetota bacterium]
MHALRALIFAACVLPTAHAQDQPDQTRPDQDLADQDLADQTLARDLLYASKRTVADAEKVVAALAESGSELRLVAVISNLEHRGGCFVDVDGDGALDYVASEHGTGKESVRVHHNVDRGWRAGTSRSRGISGHNPLTPWVLDDDGSGRRAVVLPTARPPYLFLLPLNKGGDFTGKPIALGSYLPRRLSRVRGVDNLPYTITGVEAATAGGAARIFGRMTDENDRERQDVTFELQLRDGGVLADVRQVAPGPRRLGLNQPMNFVASPAGCEHQSAERHAVLGTEDFDANADGIDDKVVLTGVLSAHVFPGRIADDQLQFQQELGRGRAVPIADLRYWFPFALQATAKERRFANTARAALDEMGFTVRTQGRYDAVLSLHTTSGRGWLVHDYATPDALVPVVDYRPSWPKTDGVHPMRERYRDQVLLDADHDRTPDVLSAHVGQSFEWLRPPPRERSVMPDDHYRDVDPGRLRAGIVLGLGERGGRGGRVLVQFDEQVKLSRRPEQDAPVAVTEVPVHGDEPGRVRYCVLFRPRSVGFFFEVAPVDRQQEDARRYQTWRRRGERRLEMYGHYHACDQGICDPDKPQGGGVCSDAAALFLAAVPHAADAVEKARVWRDVARCYSTAGELAEARRAYERFVMFGKRLEPLARPPASLAALFADEAFRALYRGWSERMPVVARDDL